jgi:16S rRNA (cytosine1402-N4)-methyltransferase
MILTDESRWTHVPVLLGETLEHLAVDPAGLYLDATVGLGGHSSALLRKAPQARVLGLDQDPEALAEASSKLAPFGERVRLRRANFKDAAAAVEAEGFFPLSGALFDIGVSSLQLDKAARGFSFMKDGPLDMRMDPAGTLTAESIVNKWPVEQLITVFKEFGEEPEAERAARAIAARRAQKPFKGTVDLAECVAAVLPRVDKHPATRVFQALRIAVNRELEVLPRGLEGVLPLLKKGGRLAVITFHSLEDRIVKNAFASFVASGSCAPVGKGAFAASEEEAALNPRARSAKLRVVEKK